MNILELFSGTGSIGKVAIDFGHHVISLDKDMEADIKTEILDWDYKTYDPGCFDLIWGFSSLHQIQRGKNDRNQTN